MPSITIKNSVLHRLDALRDGLKEETGLSSLSYSDVIEVLFATKNDKTT